LQACVKMSIISVRTEYLRATRAFSQENKLTIKEKLITMSSNRLQKGGLMFDATTNNQDA
jgi:hypothetical protein